MKKRIVAVVFLGLFFTQTAPLRAEWVSLSKGLPEAEIVFVTPQADGAGVVYAASAKRLYRLSPPEANWKQVLSVRGSESRIRFVLSDGSSPKTVYVASDKGLQKSEDSGKHWKWIYRGIGEKTRGVHYVAEDPSDRSRLWLGTGDGLVRISKDGREAVRVDSFPKAAVYSIWVGEAGSALLLVGSADGVYKSVDSGLHWERVLVEREQAPAENISTELSQFQIEELSAGPLFSNLAHVSSQNKYWTATPTGLFESDRAGSSWKRAPAEMPAKSIRHLAASSDSVYVATERGVFQWDGAAMKDLSAGLPSPDVRMLVYHALSGDLYAATRNGVHRLLKPELKIAPNAAGSPGRPDLEGLMARFRHEPTVLEVQQAAIRYAEVQPEKIEAWRRAAMRRAFLPTFSVGADKGENQNVDLDRGGTGDPDRFIIGPEERSTDWHADLSWNLGDLVWNDDQTSIDTRSKLMVELRDDILNEVTHLYFERRRLQTDLALAPPRELPLQAEKELKLQELTAGIDALTGGYLSKRIGEAGPMAPAAQTL